MYPLQLAINPEGWRLFMSRKADAVFKRLRDKIFERDHYTCQFCGFQAKEYQDVVNIDQNYRHNKMGNMVTACCFCSQCLFIDSVGNSGFGGGKLVYLPEMTQVELNSFCHVIFCAITNGTGYRDTAQNVYRSFKFRTQAVEDKFGLGASSPFVFGQMVLEYEGEARDNITKSALADLRLLPTFAKFKKQLDRWAASAAEELDEKNE